MTSPAAEPGNTGPTNTAPAVDNPPPVEQQREELAETVDALAKKLDVPARVNAAAGEHLHNAADHVQENRQIVIGTVVAAVLALGAVVAIRRRNR